MRVLQCNDSYRPIMDGVGVCVENYARHLARLGHTVAVAAPWAPGYGNDGSGGREGAGGDPGSGTDGSGGPPFTLLRYASVPLPGWKPYRLGVPRLDHAFRSRLAAWAEPAGAEPAGAEPAGAPGRGAPGDAATGPGGGIGRGAPGTGDGAGRRLDIVHSHSPFVAGKLAGRTAARYGAVHVTTFHSKYRDDFLRSIPFEAAADLFVSRLVRFYEAADAVWAPSEATAETLRSYGFSGEVEVMPNGADLEPPSSEAYGEYRRRGAQLLGLREEQPFVLLFVGQHRWEKNLRLIIDSLAELSGERARAFRMVFAGTGADLGEIRRYAGRRGVGELCDFRGLVLDREELKALYARAELFLFPSLYDNAPLVLREAAAFRTPALLASGSTAAGDTRDGRNAFHCEARPEALSSLLGRLLGDRELLRRVGEAARREVYRSWEGIVEEVAARYEALLQ